MFRLRSLLAPASVAVAALALSACGEKSEPTNPGDLPPPTTQPAPARFDITGRFRGTLRQRGLRPFRVAVAITSLRRDGRNPVRYSGLGCSGNWTYLGARAGALRFRERITRGRSRKCKGVGTVTLTPAGADRLGYEFRGGGVVSRGTLTRGR